MESSKILASLEKYFDSESDYAVLISGEWGSGKTFFLKNKVFPKILENGKRPIYISLIGLNEETQLENKVLQEINPFHSSKNKSAASIEADNMESIIKNPGKPKLNIPDDLVICFDDLERIKPEFFEAAMGFINVFIEHYNTKCVFLCNEQIIEKEKRFLNYKTVKEKYIRFTFSFNTDLAKVVEERIKKLEIENLGFDHVSVIIDVFKKGESSNIRTLFFVLSIYKQVIDRVNEFSIDIQQKSQILKLLLTYCGFYAIESKRETSFEVLDKISIAINRNDLSDLGLDEIDFSGNSVEKVPEKPNDDSVEIEKIQNRYFNDASFHFERFVSVAELIKSGYLDTDLLKNEIINLNDVLSNSELLEENRKILEVIDNFWALSDPEVEEKVEYITEKAEEGKFDLQTYLRVYQELVWIESFKTKGLHVSERITNKFKLGAKKAADSGKLRFVRNLLFQSQWKEDDNSRFGEKFRDFSSYINSLNNTVNNANEVNSFSELLNALKSCDYDQIFLLCKKDSDLSLSEENAKQIYRSLKDSNANTVMQFYRAINERYANYGSTISEMPKLEKKFIHKLLFLLSADKNLARDIEKPLSRVPLIFLRDYLKGLIKNRFPETKDL